MIPDELLHSLILIRVYPLVADPVVAQAQIDDPDVRVLLIERGPDWRVADAPPELHSTTLISYRGIPSLAPFHSMDAVARKTPRDELGLYLGGQGLGDRLEGGTVGQGGAARAEDLLQEGRQRQPPEDPSLTRQAVVGHRQIVEAVAANDGRLVEALMLAHLMRVHERPDHELPGETTNETSGSTRDASEAQGEVVCGTE